MKISRKVQDFLRDCKRTRRKSEAVLRRTHSREIAEIEAAAIEAANRFVKEAGKTLSNYKPPQLAFYAVHPNGQWSVFYTPRSRSCAKDSFYVMVDAKTTAAKLVPCR